jgi:hypothetical protein
MKRRMIGRQMTYDATLKITYEMYDALKNMFESNNTLIALTMKNQLQHIKMTKADTVATFFMRISEIRDQLGAMEKPYQTGNLS